MDDFSHYSGDGSSKMVDISGKSVTVRTAKASSFVKMEPGTISLIRDGLIPKGNVFEVARVAGIMAAKKTSGLIPMCHQLALNFVDVRIDIDNERSGLAIRSEIRLEGKTGAEMEALCAVACAALTVYDMCKAVDKKMIIEDVKLIEKTGGKSDFTLKL
jgi:cyclic pyranopterin phosphate synthase